MRAPSVGAASTAAGTEPAARTTWRGRSERGGEPAASTSTAPSAVRRAAPVTTSTPFLRSRPATPRPREATSRLFRDCIAATSIRAPSTETPCSGRRRDRLSKWCDESSRAFDGMHPTLRHVPPRAGRPRASVHRSMHVVRRPSWAQRMAAT